LDDFSWVYVFRETYKLCDEWRSASSQISFLEKRVKEIGHGTRAFCGPASRTIDARSCRLGVAGEQDWSYPARLFCALKFFAAEGRFPRNREELPQYDLPRLNRYSIVRSFDVRKNFFPSLPPISELQA
jgi:hypothetical protein